MDLALGSIAAGDRSSLRAVRGPQDIPASGRGLARAAALASSSAARDLAERSVALLALLLLVPLLLCTGLAVRLTSRGPVFFRQTRVGRGGRTFRMLKFRTMVEDAEARRHLLTARNHCDAVLFKLPGDPRVTALGRLLRRLSLDELPQLLHVVTGHMALVGPRPALPAEVALYDRETHRRLLVKPGLTGLWQVSGRSDLSWADSVRLDLDYVASRSLARDLSILARTPAAVLGGRGAY